MSQEAAKAAAKEFARPNRKSWITKDPGSGGGPVSGPVNLSDRAFAGSRSDRPEMKSNPGPETEIDPGRVPSLHSRAANRAFKARDLPTGATVRL
jgi:hypothetical protein